MIVTLNNDSVRSELKIPESLNELTADQLIAFAALTQGSVPMKDAVDCIYNLLNIPISVFKKIPKEQIHELIYVHRVADRISETLLTKQKLPKIRGYYGPSNEGDNIKGIEYTFMDIYYLNWVDTHDENSLNNMIAILYRPRKWYWSFVKLFTSLNDGDERVKFNSNTYEKRAEIIAKWPLNLKLAVMMYIHGNRQSIVNKYHAAFNPKNPSKRQPKGTETFHNILMTIAETGTFGPMSQVENEYIHNLFTFLDMKATEHNELTT